MFRSLVHFCLRFRGVVIALACVVLVYGIEVARSAKLDVFPEFVPPQVGDPDGGAWPRRRAGGDAGDHTGRDRGQRARPSDRAALRVDPGALGRDGGLRGRDRCLPRPPAAGGEAGRALVPAPARRPRADDVAAHLVHDGPAQDRPRLGSTLAHGAAHLRRLDASPAPARDPRRRPGDRLRRRGAAAPDPGAARPSARPRARARRRPGGSARFDRHRGCGLHRHAQPAHRPRDAGAGDRSGRAGAGGGGAAHRPDASASPTSRVSSRPAHRASATR